MAKQITNYFCYGSIKRTDAAHGTAKINELYPAVGKIVQALRKIIVNSNKEISERIKWAFVKSSATICTYTTNIIKIYQPIISTV